MKFIPRKDDIRKGNTIMDKIIVFAASTSRNSINKQLATYASIFLEHKDIEILDLNDFLAPLYSIDEENQSGIPENVQKFKAKLGEASAFIISLAEHNGNFTAAFKNLYDWLSCIDTNIFEKKKILLLATSPGSSGASNVLSIAKASFPWMGGEIAAEFSLPNFFDNFTDAQITDLDLKNKLIKQVKILNDQIS